MSERQRWAYWYFRLLGLTLWLLPVFVVRKLLPASDLAKRLFPSDARSQAWLFLTLSGGMLVVGGLCQLTGWGLKRNRSWTRWTGIAGCAGLLVGFPWLTLAGVGGLALLFSIPPSDVKPVVVDKSRLRRRESDALDWIVGILTGALLLVGLVLLFRFAHNLGLPHIRVGPEFWLVLIGGELLVVTFHEFGHAFAAWAVHFRFKVINVGPLTVWRDPRGHRHWKFDWARLCCGGGYTGAVPTSDKGLRFNQIFVVFAGPFVSLNAALVLFLLFLKMPGASWEGSWPIVGMFTVMFAVDFLRNLIPIGYTDGTLLLHLILWTAKGREFSSARLATKDAEEAERRQEDIDFENEVELRRSVLQQALAHGEAPSVELAAKYQALGFAEVRAQRPLEAEQSLTKSVDILKRCGDVHPLVEANSWKGLDHAYRQLQRSADACRAGSFAIRAFEKAKEKLPSGPALEVQSALAQLHIHARNYESALDEIQQALLNFSVFLNDRKRLLLKAAFFRLRAECEFSLGCQQQGLEAAETAARILRSAEIPEAQRVDAKRDLGALAVTLWMGGRSDEAIALLTEAIQFFERQGANRAGRQRVTLAQVYRKAGRLREAEAALPSGEALTPAVRESFLTERAEIYLRSARVDQAIACFEEVLLLKKADQHANSFEIAGAESSLAEALLEAERVKEAEAMARTACDVLVTTQHPNSAGCLVTLALIARQRQQESAGAYLDEGFRIVSEASLIQAASKARFFESAADRLERHGWTRAAGEWRAAAQQQWQAIGLKVEPQPVPEASMSGV